MAEVDLSPADLDRLEDALEDLELDGSLERWLEDEPSPRVRERLTDYRSLLIASREAMPIEEVPAGLLDGVLNEAKQAAAVAPDAATASSGWWTRLRRSFMVPALALAGTAALVLWIGRPDEQAELTDPPATPTANNTRTVRLSFEEEPEDEAVEASARGSADPAAAPPAAVAPETVDGQGKLGAEQDDGIVQPTEVPALEPLGDAPDLSNNTASGTAQQQPTDAKPGAGGSTAGRWDLISLGDRARQAGDCVAAREEYAVALEDDEARVRSRAFAGIGLCDRQAGDTPSADANFDRARELDGGIDGFIDSQYRARPSSKRAKKKRKSAPKSKSKANQQVMDPFG